MIDWGAFVTVFVATLISASVAVALFSLGLRFGGRDERWGRVVSVLLFIAVAALVLFGLYIIVGDHLTQLLGA
ncbi:MULTISPECIES: hypothetical protein [unclassified Salinibacterium]|uniref:hypothetical protein n=1 Tax=unclassified Salinibacterium TaxID=2632331 RepID=UPI001420ED45|nr:MULTISPECIES: hypothetical protein [unclassified Salinibacterium]